MAGGHQPSSPDNHYLESFSADQPPRPTELGIRVDVAEITDNLLFNLFGSFIIASYHFN